MQYAEERKNRKMQRRSTLENHTNIDDDLQCEGDGNVVGRL